MQRRNDDRSVSCPRDTFYEYIPTPDLRQGLEYGYKAEVLCGVIFPRACVDNVLFGEFVDKLYNIKATATDVVQKSIAKLSINSTYGKFAQRESEYIIKLVDNKGLEEIISKYHYNYIGKITEEITLIKYGPRLNEKLRLIYKENAKDVNLNEIKDLQVNRTFKKVRSMPSAVKISAMISGFGRASINPYKNIQGNKCIASNTDSLILTHPLPNDLIGTGLGQ